MSRGDWDIQSDPSGQSADPVVSRQPSWMEQDVQEGFLDSIWLELAERPMGSVAALIGLGYQRCLKACKNKDDRKNAGQLFLAALVTQTITRFPGETVRVQGWDLHYFSARPEGRYILLGDHSVLHFRETGQDEVTVSAWTQEWEMKGGRERQGPVGAPEFDFRIELGIRDIETLLMRKFVELLGPGDYAPMMTRNGMDQGRWGQQTDRFVGHDQGPRPAYGHRVPNGYGSPMSAAPQSAPTATRTTRTRKPAAAKAEEAPAQENGHVVVKDLADLGSNL